MSVGTQTGSYSKPEHCFSDPNWAFCQKLWHKRKIPPFFKVNFSKISTYWLLWLPVWACWSSCVAVFWRCWKHTITQRITCAQAYLLLSDLICLWKVLLSGKQLYLHEHVPAAVCYSAVWGENTSRNKVAKKCHRQYRLSRLYSLSLVIFNQSEAVKAWTQSATAAVMSAAAFKSFKHKCLSVNLHSRQPSCFSLHFRLDVFQKSISRCIPLFFIFGRLNGCF